jgi:hypothetical protein
MMRALVLAALVAGCSDPTFTLRFRVTAGAADACTSATGAVATQCQDVPMSCAAVVSIRVFNPNTPTSPVISVCQELMMASNPTLCEIAQVTLPPPTSPVEAQTLEVEILVYPKNKLEIDMATNLPICPAMVDIGIDGFPTPSLVPCMPEGPCDATPAVGGIAFYHPGDPETIVELGCADLKLLNDPVCTGMMTAITTTVTDFDTLVSVPGSLASHLTVEVGSTMGSNPTTFSPIPPDLKLDPTMTTPTWDGAIAGPPAIACIQVDETDVAARTSSVRCSEPVWTDPPPIQLVGTRLAKASLDDIVSALGFPEFPAAGLVVGIVLDEHGNPASGLQVSGDMIGSTVPTIQYLSAMRNSVGGTATSTAGIFLSTNAPFGTEFSAIQNGERAKAVGGLMVGKVTIVVLQIPSQAPT